MENRNNGSDPCIRALIASEYRYRILDGPNLNSYEDVKIRDITGYDYVPAVLDWVIPNPNQSLPADSNCTRVVASSQNGPSGWRCECYQGLYDNPCITGSCTDLSSSNKNSRAKWAIVGVSSSLGSIILLLALWRLYIVVRKRIIKKRKEKFFKQNGGLLLQQRLSSGEVIPLLVYEFIPNGNPFECLHDQNEDLPMTWNMRLRIATEIAGALFYLHSIAYQPIYHRDIKFTNILLDGKYRAKLVDFGTSIIVSTEATHLTTVVKGTFGYLDLEYFHTSQFTEKSDVYSFGVVLVELLTGQKPISSIKSEEVRSLASYFVLSMEKNCLFDIIIDKRVMKERKQEHIIAVANLAYRCLELNGRKRPTMKEVTLELERIQGLDKKSDTQHYHEEIELVGNEVPWTGYSTFDTLLTLSG